MGDPSGTGGWYSVRCVYTWGRTDAETYEERTTLWCAASFDDAIARAEDEAHRYAAEMGEALFRYLGFAQAYQLADEPADGAELFSLLRISPLEPDEYLSTHFDTGTERQQHSGDA